MIISGAKEQCHSFNLTFSYIDDVLSIDNPIFIEYLDIYVKYPSELEIKDTSDFRMFKNKYQKYLFLWCGHFGLVHVCPYLRLVFYVVLLFSHRSCCVGVFFMGGGCNCVTTDVIFIKALQECYAGCD